MKEEKDQAILIANKEFQKILSTWKELNEKEKGLVCGKYDLKDTAEVDELRLLWLGLDFRVPELEDPTIEYQLEETIWKIADRKGRGIFGNSKFKKIHKHFGQIAAILIVPLLIYTGYLQFYNPSSKQGKIPHLITVNASAGVVTQLALPDGTKVFLNSESSITYPEYFQKISREVSIKGEVFFEVIKDKKKPMLVSMNNLKVKVYGTTFNVDAFPDENYSRVTLVEGSVALSSPSMKLNGKDEFFIEPGQTVTLYEKSKKLKIDTSDPFVFTAWKDGFLVFENTPFEVILKKLSRKFNVDIILKDSQLASIPMDATFTDESVSEILRLLSIGTSFRFYYEKPKKLNDGSFERSKIYIESK